MNMQSIPLVSHEAPFVSTGMDEVFGDKILAKREMELFLWLMQNVLL